VVEAIGRSYRRSQLLEMGSVHTIEPVVVVQYEPGVALIVSNVEVKRDRVRLLFAACDPADDAARDGVATALTVKWPITLSNSLSERAEIEKLIRQFVDDAAR
jgi:hypothetical protein